VSKVKQQHSQDYLYVLQFKIIQPLHSWAVLTE